MRAILRIDIGDWTEKAIGLPRISKGTSIHVDRVPLVTADHYSEYVGTVRLKGISYSFELHHKEFEPIN